MGDTCLHREQRTEPRFPLHFHTSLRAIRNGSSTFSGQMRNISIHGVMLTVQSPVSTYDNFDICFHVPQSPKMVKTQGIVKWCSKNPGSYLLGIRFLESTSFCIPFHHMAKAFEVLLHRETNGKSRPENNKQRTQMQHFHDELYCGVFYSLFRKEIQHNIMNIIFNIDALSFYIQSIYQDLPNQETNKKTRKHTQEAFLKSKKIKDLSDSLLFFLNHKSKKDISHISESIDEFINIDTILFTCIDNLNSYLSHILIQDYNPIKYTAYDTPRITGKRDAFEHCFDYLILASYQFFFSRRVRQVRIELKTSKDTLLVTFINDGSQMLQNKELEIDYTSIALISSFYFRDQRHITWLWYAISNVRTHHPKLTVQSESGNNVITLHIPLYT